MDRYVKNVLDGVVRQIIKDLPLETMRSMLSKQDGASLPQSATVPEQSLPWEMDRTHRTFSVSHGTSGLHPVRFLCLKSCEEYCVQN